MDYDKLISLINKEGMSMRAAAKIAQMTPGGFSPMLKKQTMSVKTLELLAAHFGKPVSYFFDEESEVDLVAGEPTSGYYTVCGSCARKDGMIELLKDQLREKDKIITEQTKKIGVLEQDPDKNGDSNDKDQTRATG